MPKQLFISKSTFDFCELMAESTDQSAEEILDELAGERINAEEYDALSAYINALRALNGN